MLHLACEARKHVERGQNYADDFGFFLLIFCQQSSADDSLSVAADSGEGQSTKKAAHKRKTADAAPSLLRGCSRQRVAVRTPQPAEHFVFV